MSAELIDRLRYGAAWTRDKAKTGRFVNLKVDTTMDEAADLISAQSQTISDLTRAASDVCFADSIRDRLMQEGQGATVDQMQQAGTNLRSAIQKLRAALGKR